MDQAAEVVEEKMLRRAERIHRKWLVFDSLRKVHQGAVLKASYELFAAELGHETAHRLHKYLESVRVAQDEIIIEEGEQVNTLFMLHAGRATAFTSSDDSTVEYRRLHTITRGWFNTECLIEHVRMMQADSRGCKAVTLLGSLVGLFASCALIVFNPPLSAGCLCVLRCRRPGLRPGCHFRGTPC